MDRNRSTPREPSGAGNPLMCWSEDLVGGRGPARVLVSWAVLVLLAGLAFVAGLGPLLLLVLVLGTAAALLVRSAGRSWHRAVVVVVALLGVAALACGWSAWGALLDAADAGRPVPAWAGWTGPSLLLALACAAAFAVTAALSLRRCRRPATTTARPVTSVPGSPRGRDHP